MEHKINNPPYDLNEIIKEWVMLSFEIEQVFYKVRSE